MTFIMVNTSKFRSFEQTSNNLSRDMADIRNDLSSLGRSLDWDVRAEAGIERTIGSVTRSIENQSILFNKMSNFFAYAHREYSELDKEFTSQLKEFKNWSTITPGENSILDDFFDFLNFEGISKNENSKISEIVDLLKEVYSHGWKLFDNVLPGLMSIKSGFKLVQQGNKWIVYGKRNANNFLEEKYLKWRRELGINLHTTNGTNSIVRKPWAWLKRDILEDFKLNKKQLKGGGILGSLISTGVNIYEYGWGEKSNEGLSSSEFLSSLTIDIGKGAIQGVIATAAGILATAGAGAAFGSVVPGLGTAVGFAVGIGLAVLDNTAWGQKATNWTEVKVNKAFEWTGDQINKIGEGIGKVGDTVSGWSKNLFSW